MADREMNKTGGTAPESAGGNCVPRLDSVVARTAEKAIDVTERYTHLKLDPLPCKLRDGWIGCTLLRIYTVPVVRVPFRAPVKDRRLFR